VRRSSFFRPFTCSWAHTHWQKRRSGWSGDAWKASRSSSACTTSLQSVGGSLRRARPDRLDGVRPACLLPHHAVDHGREARLIRRSLVKASRPRVVRHAWSALVC
jgi:hypothetical protein